MPVLNETDSLCVTVETIFKLVVDTVYEVLIVISGNTTEESRRVIGMLRDAHPGFIRLYQQKVHGLGGALQEAFEVAGGDYVMLMASDLETDPAAIPNFVAKMQEGRWDIICGSRWIGGGGFSGYGVIRLVLNWVFQGFFRVLYGTTLTDLTYAYRLYRREVLVGVAWAEVRHAFLLECLLKPLRLGARVTEIPCKWKARSQGKSHGSLWQMFRYIPLALRIRWMRVQ